MNETPDLWITFWEPNILSNGVQVWGYCVKDYEVCSILTKENNIQEYIDDPKMVKLFVKEFEPKIKKKRKKRE